MTMTKRIIKTLGIVAAICVLPTAFTSCDKEGLFHGGKAIRFTASVKSTPDTRTSYSGVVTSGKERIDWSIGDKITIWSDNASVTSGSANFANYEITSVTPDGAISKAKIKNAGANGLSFNNGSGVDSDGYSCQFWSVYPSSVTVNKVDGMAVCDSEGGKTIGFTAEMDQYQDLVLNTATNKYEPDNLSGNTFMTAYVSGSFSSENEIDLSFYPAFTAYEVEIKCAEGLVSDVTVQRFIIDESAVRSPDKITAVWSDGDWSYSVGVPTKLYGVFPANVTVPAYSATKGLVFTVLAIPIDNPADASSPDPRITFEYTVDGVEYTKSLKLTGVTFGACKKHKLTGLLLPANEWKIIFAEEGMEVKEWVTGNDQELVVE